MLKILLLVTGLFAATAQAVGPSAINVTYDLYRNGLKLGQVNDIFTRTGNAYVLVSETHAIGPLKILLPGNFRLESRGVVTSQGMRPSQFEHGRSDAPGKRATARLDWSGHSIDYQYKGKSWQVNGLQDGAQDQLSQLYQFMFVKRLPHDYDLQVVGGRDLNDFHYVRSDGGIIQTPMGALATQQFQRITQKPDEKSITVWVAPARNNLPVQIRVSEDGVTMEQRMVRASVNTP